MRVDEHEQLGDAATVTGIPATSPLDLDRALIDAAPAFEHPVLTAVFVLLSAWWIKGPLLIALGFASDLRSRRLPVAAVAAALAVAATSLAVDLLKQAFDRVRPPIADSDLGSLVPIPGNPSFPSGHSATAFAAATVIALISPKLRWWALGLAAAVAVSRVYLRVHYPLDVIAGAVVGAGLGALVALVVMRLLAGAGPRAASAGGEQEHRAQKHHSHSGTAAQGRLRASIRAHLSRTQHLSAS